METQAEWIAAVLAGRLHLPAPDQTWRVMKRAEGRTRQRFPAAGSHSLWMLIMAFKDRARAEATAWRPTTQSSRCYDAFMRLRDAIDMLANADVDALGPTIWADLGCGDGTFTLALADRLASGSVVHAIDLDGSALRRIPSAHKGVRISTYRGDFMKQPWPFVGLNGILMANSLHYVENQAAFIRECESHMNARRYFLLVEYDTSEASRWIPYPVSRTRLATLFERAGYSSVRVLRSRPSLYRRASLYAIAVGPL